MFHSEPFLRCKETGQCFSSFYFFLIYFCPFPRSFPERSIYRNWWQHSPFQFLGSLRCVSHLLPWIPNPKWKLEKPHLQHWATGPYMYPNFFTDGTKEYCFQRSTVTVFLLGVCISTLCRLVVFLENECVIGTYTLFCKAAIFISYSNALLSRTVFENPWHNSF